MSSESSKKLPEPRLVTVRKAQAELGIQLCGGNLRGIFVERLEEDSPARGADGLMHGDFILEVQRAAVLSLCLFQGASEYRIVETAVH